MSVGRRHLWLAVPAGFVLLATLFGLQGRSFLGGVSIVLALLAAIAGMLVVRPGTRWLTPMVVPIALSSLLGTYGASDRCALRGRSMGDYGFTDRASALALVGLVVGVLLALRVDVLHLARLLRRSSTRGELSGSGGGGVPQGLAPPVRHQVPMQSPIRRWEAVLVAVLALIPFVRALLLWRQGWVPLGDNANIAIRGADFGTTDTPLLGMPSGLVGLAPGTNSTHPGPLVFWVIGPWVRVLGYHALPVLLGTAVVGSAATCAILWCARRQAGTRGLVAAAGVLTMITVLVGYNLVQPLNPAIALLPAVAAMVAAAAVVNGDNHAIPVLALAASFAAQAESAYAPILVVVALAVIVLRWRRRAPRSPSRRVWAVTALVVTLCWVGPVLDMVANGGGNVRETLRASFAADLQPQGWPASRAAVQSMFHPVAWATSIQDGAPSSSPAAIAVLVVVLVVFGALARWGLRQDRRTVGALLALAGVAVVATVGSQALTPGSAGRQAPYLLPVLATGAFIWYLAGTTALDLARRSGSGRLTRVAAAVGLVASAMTVERLLDPWYLEPGSEAVAGLSAQIEGELSSGPYLLIPAGGSNSQSVLRGVGFYLVGDGIEVRYPQDQVNFVGANRVDTVEPRPLEALVITRPLPVNSAPKGWRLVADWSPAGVAESELSALRSDVAGAMRRSGLRFTHQAGAFQIGQVLAATEGDDPASLTDQDHLNQLGEDLRAHPDRLSGLSDLTLATMLEEQVLQDDMIDYGLMVRFWLATREDELQLWVIPSDR